jgi:hypothetical protein
MDLMKLAQKVTQEMVGRGYLEAALLAKKLAVKVLRRSEPSALELLLAATSRSKTLH